MQFYNRKMTIIITITIIMSVITALTVYSYVSSQSFLNNIYGERIDFSTHRKVLYDMYPNEEYTLFREQRDWVDFLNRTYNSDYFSDIYNETVIHQAIRSKSNYLNFSDHIYFGAYWGLHYTGGYEIEITELFLKDNILTVFIEKEDQSGGMVTQALTFPYQLISIDKDDIPSDVTVDVKCKEFGNFFWIILFEFSLIFLLLIIIMIEKRRLKKLVNNDHLDLMSKKRNRRSIDGENQFK